ncbi:MAG: hypothetical protein HY898_36960 [Deltaproteobacteria bacterium]|nr:hypothetical protein [Deltaproteobacteria bacterium]
MCAVQLTRWDLWPTLPCMKLGWWLGTVIVLATGAGCGGNGNPNFNTVSHQFYKSYCVRLHSCLVENLGQAAGDASYTKAYPAGDTDCIDQNFKEFSSLDSLSSTCTQEQWDTCTKDVETTTCVPSTLVDAAPVWGPKIPDSCRGC